MKKFTRNNLGNSRSANFINCSQFSLFHSAFILKFYTFCIFYGKNALASSPCITKWTSIGSAFRNFIFNIIGMCTYEKMAGTNALRIIAFMTNYFSGRYHSIFKNPGKPMSSYNFSFPKTCAYNAITASLRRAIPDPTFRSFMHFSPKSFFYCSTKFHIFGLSLFVGGA